MAQPTPIDFRTNAEFNKNQALNMVVHNVSAFPDSPVAGQICIKGGVLYVYTGNSWVTCIVQIATDAQASAGTAEDVAINPKQHALKAPLASPAFTGTPTAPTATAGTNTTQLATTAYVQTEIAAATLNAKIYKGVWDTTSATDYSALNSYRPIKAGWYFTCSGTGCTIDGVEYNAGDAITFNQAVASGVTITTSMIDKTDNTESSDLVRKDEAQTLTNKTINGSNNTISNLLISMFASGEVLTTFDSTKAKLCTCTALATWIGNNYQTKLTFSTGLTNTSGTVTVDHPFIGLSAGSIAYGGVGGTLTELTKGTDGQVLTLSGGLPVWQAPTAGTAKETYLNTALTPDSDGTCTWNIAHTLNSSDLMIRVYEVSTGETVFVGTACTSATNVKITFKASGNVAANTYKAVLVA